MSGSPLNGVLLALSGVGALAVFAGRAKGSRSSDPVVSRRPLVLFTSAQNPGAALDSQPVLTWDYVDIGIPTSAEDFPLHVHLWHSYDRAFDQFYEHSWAEKNLYLIAVVLRPIAVLVEQDLTQEQPHSLAFENSLADQVYAWRDADPHRARRAVALWLLFAQLADGSELLVGTGDMGDVRDKARALRSGFADLPDYTGLVARLVIATAEAAVPLVAPEEGPDLGTPHAFVRTYAEALPPDLLTSRPVLGGRRAWLFRGDILPAKFWPEITAARRKNP